MKNTVVVGAQWGDEGKAKITDLLAEYADVIIRYQGGCNAGHTVVANNETYKFPKVDGTTFVSAYEDEACTQQVTGSLEHKHFFDILDELNEGDCLILNNTRVLPARIYGVKKDTGAIVEFLLLNNLGNNRWECITGPGKRAKIDTEFSFGDGILSCKIIEVLENGNLLCYTYIYVVI